MVAEVYVVTRGCGKNPRRAVIPCQGEGLSPRAKETSCHPVPRRGVVTPCQGEGLSPRAKERGCHPEPGRGVVIPSAARDLLLATCARNSPTRHRYRCTIP